MPLINYCAAYTRSAMESRESEYISIGEMELGELRLQDKVHLHGHRKRHRERP
jgi:hypothetical protein